MHMKNTTETAFQWGHILRKGYIRRSGDGWGRGERDLKKHYR